MVANNINFQTLAVDLPPDLELTTIKSRDDVLVLREPIAYDYALVESLLNQPNTHQRVFAMALRLAVTFNGEAGVTAGDIGRLDRFAYKGLVDYISTLFLDIVPEFSEAVIQKYLPTKPE